jgi:hypothetical protein
MKQEYGWITQQIVEDFKTYAKGRVVTRIARIDRLLHCHLSAEMFLQDHSNISRNLDLVCATTEHNPNPSIHFHAMNQDLGDIQLEMPYMNQECRDQEHPTKPNLLDM